MRKSGGLDVEAAGNTEEVQKGFARAADWTLKRREGEKKSKRDLKCTPYSGHAYTKLFT